MNMQTGVLVSLRRTTIRVGQMPYSVVLVLGFIVLFVSYLFAAQYITNNSDDASIIFEGQAMLHCNIFMHGWYLPSDSFITSEMPLYALGSLILSPQALLKVGPALLYASTVLLAVVLARKVVPQGTSRWLAIGACLALIAFPIGLMFSFVLRSPMHIATIFLTLVAFWAYDRYVRQHTPGFALILFSFITTISIIGDPMAQILIPIPIAIVSGRMLWKTRGSDVIARTVLIVAGGSLLAGFALRQVLILSGTHINTTSIHLAVPAQILPHLSWLFLGIATLFHIDFIEISPGNINPLIIILNGAFLLITVAGFVRLMQKVLFPGELRDSFQAVLGWAILSLIAVFLFTTFAINVLTIRYLFPAFIYAGILLYPAITQVIPKRVVTGGVLTFLALSILTFSVTLVQRPAATTPEKPLITFLHNQHLTNGLGSFWVTNITVLKSDHSVQLLPVIILKGEVHAYNWHADAAWFRGDSVNKVQFLAYDDSEDVTQYYQAALLSFGMPAHMYRVDHYTILTWDHPIISPTYHL